MNKLKSFLKDDWARIPFSVIGVFLLLGSSVTTVYIAQLEQQKAEDISSTFEINDIEPVVQYVEADLARCLNYAACKAFEEVGKNPVVVPVNNTILYSESINDGKINGADININRVRFEAYRNLKEMVAENFQNDRYIKGDYNVTVTIPDAWEQLHLEDVIELRLNRTLNNLINNCNDIYHVYPVFSIKASISVYDLEQQKTVLEKKPVIMTIITNRFLLLEELTNEFDYRINGSWGSLGVNCLLAAMPLTWIHGWAQHFTDKPLNIVSTKWLEVITNGALLLEEGFVFNSVDPLGVVYTGYETVLAIAEDFGKKFDGDDLKKYLTDQVDTPMGTNDLQRRNDMIMSDFGETPLNQSQLQFNVDVNISMICGDAFDWISGDPEGEKVMAVLDGFSAEMYTNVSREKPPGTDNEGSIKSTQAVLFTSSLDAEQERVEDAKTQAPCEDGWRVVPDSMIFINAYSSKDCYPCQGDWAIDSTSYNGPCSFDNSGIPVVVDGESWDVKRSQPWTYSWQTWSKWEGMQTNGTHYVPIDAFDLSKISHTPPSYTHTQTQWVNITFESKVFSPLGGTNNDICTPFENTSFAGQIDPNLWMVYKRDLPLGTWTVVQRYKLDIGWPDEDDIRDEYLRVGDGVFTEMKYPQPMEGKYKYQYLMYPGWIYDEITEMITYWMTQIPTEIQTSETVDQNTSAAIFENTTTSTLLTDFINKRGSWEADLDTRYKTADRVKYTSAAAKVLYHIAMMYLDKTQDMIEMVTGENSVKTAIDDAFGDKYTYDQMETDMSNAKSLGESLRPDFPLGFVLNLTRPAVASYPYSSWTERFQCAVVQKPSFYSKENYGEYYSSSGHSAEEKCQIRYQNINVFSPGAGVSSLIDRGFDAVNSMVCSALDMGFDKLQDVADAGGETVQAEVKLALDNITDQIYDDLLVNLSEDIISSFENSATVQHLNVSVDDLGIDSIVQEVLSDSRYPGGMENNSRFATDLNTSQLAWDISSKLQGKIDEQYGYLSGEIKQEIMDVLDEQVFSVFTQVVSETISSSKELLKKEYGTLSSKLQTWADDEISKLISSFIPAGLPLLPYIGWVITLNVWYIDVSGQIPYFQVVDTYDETQAHPFWGHTAQEYTRQHLRVLIDLDGNGIPEYHIGKNTPVDFEYKTATLVIVPPNKVTGMGDRIGGWEELSEYP